MEASLLDDKKKPIAHLKLKRKGDLFLGIAEIVNLSSEAVKIFSEFEDLANNQVFSLLGKVAEKIQNLGYLVAFESQSIQRIEDLQIFDLGGPKVSISFHLPKRSGPEGSPPEDN